MLMGKEGVIAMQTSEGRRTLEASVEQMVALGFSKHEYTWKDRNEPKQRLEVMKEPHRHYNKKEFVYEFVMHVGKLGYQGALLPVYQVYYFDNNTKTDSKSIKFVPNCFIHPDIREGLRGSTCYSFGAYAHDVEDVINNKPILD